MSVRTQEIAREFKRIRSDSPEDIAVLMAPLIRALEQAPAPPPLGMDAAQLAAIAGSLAQMAAQADDAETAIAIASLQAEIETLSADELLAPEPGQGAVASPDADRSTAIGADPAAPAEVPPPSASAAVDSLAHPVPQLIGLASICALSYVGYLTIEAAVRPGSLANWLLTAGSTLLALGLALRWRRFVMPARPGFRLTAATLALALSAGGALFYGLTALYSAREPMVVESVAPVPQNAPAAGADDGSTDSAGPAPTSEVAERPIALWWMGDAAPLPARGPSARSLALPPSAPEGARASAPEHDAGGARPDSDLGPLADADPTPRSARTPTPQERYRSMVDRKVVVTDTAGVYHRGTLTGISKDGVTLRTEVLMFSAPIQVHRLFFFANISSVQPE